VFVNGFITIGVLALLALVGRKPFVFPSLGPHLFGCVGTFILGIETGMFAEHLLNNRLQMRCCGATEEFVTLTKQMKIGLCEQVRVN
jgi:hypothetical protein